MLTKIKEYIEAQLGDFRPQIAVILGSGLGGFADGLKPYKVLEYKDIPDFPQSSVEGHKGRLIFAQVGGRNIVAMQGRFHFYEGYEMQKVTLPIRLFHDLGVKTLFVSNAAGGINPSFKVGDLMLISDHINLMPNPLIGKNDEKYGVRFPDMHDCYSSRLRSIAKQIAQEEGIKLQEGVYVGGSGPTYETQAEYKYFGIIGGDAAGMSTTPEVIVARHCSLEVFGVSVITNVGLSDEVGDHEDVQKQAMEASERMNLIFNRLIERA